MPDSYDTNGLTFTTDVIVSGGGAGGNAMTGYRSRQPNNWLFGNPAAGEFNNFIAINQDFQQSFKQGMSGAGRTLQTGLQQVQKFAANSQNLIYAGGAILLAVVLLKQLGGGGRRR